MKKEVDVDNHDTDENVDVDVDVLDDNEDADTVGWPGTPIWECPKGPGEGARLLGLKIYRHFLDKTQEKIARTKQARQYLNKQDWS